MCWVIDSLNLQNQLYACLRQHSKPINYIHSGIGLTFKRGVFTDCLQWKFALWWGKLQQGIHNCVHESKRWLLLIFFFFLQELCRLKTARNQTRASTNVWLQTAPGRATRPPPISMCEVRAVLQVPPLSKQLPQQCFTPLFWPCCNFVLTSTRVELCLTFRSQDKQKLLSKSYWKQNIPCFVLNS